MNALVLIGHGSLKSSSGAAMIRLAARLRAQAVAQQVEAGFLNYSRPTLQECVRKVIHRGANLVQIQPYFLIDGVYVRVDLRREVETLKQHHPGVAFVIGESFGAHPALVEIARDRLRAADPSLGAQNGPACLLIIAHGTPVAGANGPLVEIAARLHARCSFAQTSLCFLDCNQPDIPGAIDVQVQAGCRRILLLPYFLHRGRHVRDDIPHLLAASRSRHPHLPIQRAAHLGYDLRLLPLIRERCRWQSDPDPAPPAGRALSHATR